MTVNPDNRLMSATTLTKEFALLTEAFDYSLVDIRRLVINAAKSVFAPYAVRKTLVDASLRPNRPTDLAVNIARPPRRARLWFSP